MLPTLRDGDRLLIRYAVAPRPGRLVVVQLPDSPAGPRPLALKRATARTADGSWWVESDNLGVGTDSWTVGPVPGHAVQAVVLCRLPRWLTRGARRPPPR